MSEELLTSTFVQLRKRILRQALRWFPSAEDAEDALQDAFVRLWPKAGQLGTSHDIEALTAVTVRHIGIDLHRQRQKMPTTDLDDNVQSTEFLTGGFPASNNDEEREQQLRIVERIIAERLTPLQQDIIHRRDYEGQSYANIASTLHMQETAVRMQLSRARKAIRATYHELRTKHNGQ